jgi:hypothetical protein
MRYSDRDEKMNRFLKHKTDNEVVYILHEIHKYLVAHNVA